MLLGAVSNAGNLPYWSTANQFGLMPSSSGCLALAGASTGFDESRTFQWRWGAALAANAQTDGNGGIAVKPMVDELYGCMRFRNVPFRIDLGMKHQPMDFLACGDDLGEFRNSLGTLSTTGGHLVWSGNARTLPGYAIQLEPWDIPGTKKHLWLYGTFGDYWTIDNRYCQNAMIHSTKAFIRVDFAKHFSFHFGLDHYAVWGGKGSDVAVTFPNYLRVITGLNAGSEGSFSDRMNVIGDHGGGEMIKFEYNDERYHAVFQHEIPYADGSGMGFQNFPDGINTLYFGWKDKDRWVSDLLYEFAYTMYQSGSMNGESFDKDGNSTTPEGASTTGGDNYFNNGGYVDGWTYFGNTIGFPLFFPVEQSPEGYTLGVRNNRLIAHHFGMSGKLFKKAPYKLMLTYSKNYGTYHEPYAGESAWQKPWGSVEETPYEQFSAGFSGEYTFRIGKDARHGISLTYGIFTDIGQVLDKSFGGTLGIRYSFR